MAAGRDCNKVRNQAGGGEKGVSEDAVFGAIRIASVVHGLAVILDRVEAAALTPVTA